MNIETSVKHINSLISNANALLVHNAIEIGKYLFILKERLDSGEWEKFVQEKFNFSFETSEKYMKISQAYIHVKYHEMGTECLLDMINTGTDLSHETIDRFCRGCDAYGEGDNCMLIFYNQIGECPCTNCDSKNKDCPDMCDEMYEWEDKVDGKKTTSQIGPIENQ